MQTMAPKDADESYLHYAAKAAVVGWLRSAAREAGDGVEWWSACGLSSRPNRGAPYYGVYDEYPLTTPMLAASCGEVWDELGWWGPAPEPTRSWPDAKWMRQNHGPGFVVADIATVHKGAVSAVIEIVHKSGLSDAKSAMYGNCSRNIDVVLLDAYWVLSQVARPERLIPWSEINQQREGVKARRAWDSPRTAWGKLREEDMTPDWMRFA